MMRYRGCWVAKSERRSPVGHCGARSRGQLLPWSRPPWSSTTGTCSRPPTSCWGCGRRGAAPLPPPRPRRPPPPLPPPATATHRRVPVLPRAKQPGFNFESQLIHCVINLSNFQHGMSNFKSIHRFPAFRKIWPNRAPAYGAILRQSSRSSF